MLNSAARSSTVRAMGPTTSRPPRMIGSPSARATRPALGLRPTSPQWLQGVRTEPPPSVPIASGPTPLATDATAPALEEPGVTSSRHGLRVVPYFGVLTMPRPVENSEQVVFPRITAPASRTRMTGVSSFSGTKPSKTDVPHEQGSPPTAMLSLIEIGTPSSAPTGDPRALSGQHRWPWRPRPGAFFVKESEKVQLRVLPRRSVSITAASAALGVNAPARKHCKSLVALSFQIGIIKHST